MSGMAKWAFLTAYGLTVLAIAGWYAAGEPGLLAVPVFVFGAVPLIDRLCGNETRNPSPDEARRLAEHRFYTGVLLAWIPVQLALLGWGLAVVAPQADAPGVLLLSLAAGIITGGVGITIAHELGHRRDFHARWGARILLASVHYLHFTVEHNRGHHARVATPDDPATARPGESFWCFLPRTLAGSLSSAWRLEAKRLHARGRRVIDYRNQVLWSVLLPPVLTLPAGAVFGWRSAVFLALQGVVAATLLEAVNYIEHYGLVRGKRPDGRYRRVGLEHSWNTPRRFTNWLLFNLQRHSDHHVDAGQPYQVLRHHEATPVLPAGYPTMILMALVPPVWHRVMDRRAARWRTEVST